jgi:hypothetical protein
LISTQALRHSTRHLLLTLLFCCHQGWTAPEILSDEIVHDFGVLYFEDHPTYAHQFTIQNAGDEPLLIRELKTSCGCTRAEISSKEIPPGETATLEAELSFRHRRGKERIRITLLTNDPKNPAYEVGLAGYLIQHWEISPPSLEGLVIPSSATETRIVSVISNQLLDEAPWTILSATSDHPGVSVHFPGEAKTSEERGFRTTLHTCEIRIRTEDKPVRNVHAAVYLKTSDPVCPTLQTHLTWTVEDDLILRPRSLHLVLSRYHRDSGKPVPAGLRDHGSVTLESLSKTPFKILSASAPAPFLASCKEGIPSVSAEVIVSITGEAAGEHHGNLEIMTDRKGEERFEVQLDGDLQPQTPIYSSPSPFKHVGVLFQDEITEVTQSFTIQNLGRRDLVLVADKLEDATASLSKTILPPGEQAQLLAQWNLKGKAGSLNMPISLVSNDPAAPTPSFHLAGIILPHWRLEPGHLVFRSVSRGSEEKKTLKLIQHIRSWEKPAVLAPAQTPDGEIILEPGVTRTTFDANGVGTATTELTLRLVTAHPPGHWTGQITPGASQPNTAPPPSLSVEWQVLGDLRTRPTVLVLGAAGPGRTSSPAKLRILSKERKAFSIQAVEAPPGVELREMEKKPDEAAYEVTLTKPILGSARIIFLTDRPDEPKLEVEVLPQK